MNEEMKGIKEIVEQLWKEATWVSGEKVAEIVDEIDSIFHKNGYVVSHDKIAHFVVECIREKWNSKTKGYTNSYRSGG